MGDIFTTDYGQLSLLDLSSALCTVKMPILVHLNLRRAGKFVGSYETHASLPKMCMSDEIIYTVYAQPQVLSRQKGLPGAWMVRQCFARCGLVVVGCLGGCAGRICAGLHRSEGWRRELRGPWFTF